MGMIQDITALMRKGPELAAQVNNIKFNTKSVARGAKDATFQFGCLMADSAPVNMAHVTTKSLDQVYASFTQTWLSVNSMFDITIDPTPLSYLKKLHQNFKLESYEEGEESMESFMEKVYDGSHRLYMNPEKTYGILFNVANQTSLEMMESHKEQLSEFMTEFNLEPLEVMEADEVNPEYLFGKAVLQGEIEKNRLDRQNEKLRQSDDGIAPKLLTDREVKRANDMMPYGIQVRLIAVNDKKEFVQYIDFIVGVKTILHPVPSDDMIENIARAVQNRSVFFKFLRWTTGEISLIKDIILNLNDIKTDVASRSRQNNSSPFFNTLKRLKNRKISVSNLTVPHALIPNTPIVITSYEADYLKNNLGIDVRNEVTVKKLIDSLFLMAFIILDEGTNTISVLYDGDDAFQIYALETLEKELMMNSNKLGREIGRMISR